MYKHISAKENIIKKRFELYEQNKFWKQLKYIIKINVEKNTHKLL